MADFIAGSFSRIKDYDDCPKKFFYKYVAPKDQRVPYIESAQMRQGKVIHQQLEDRINSNGQTPFAPGYEYLDKWTAPILAAPGHKFAEHELTVDQNLAPCGAKDWDRAYIRTKIDVTVLCLPNAFMLDYKSGNPKYSNDLQLDIDAALVFNHYPEVEFIGGSFAYLQPGVPSNPLTYTRTDLPGIWGKVLGFMDSIQASNRTGDWPAKRNGLCAFCEVNKMGKCQEARAWGIKPRS